MGAFMCMLGMAMACEEVQSTTAMVGQKHDLGDVFGCSTHAAKMACDGIDETFTTMSQLFHLKYKTFNPLMNTDADDVVKEVGEKRLPTVKAIKALCREKCMFITATLYEEKLISCLVTTFMEPRMFVEASPDNLARYYGRLVARFLNAFWAPDVTGQEGSV